MLEPRQRHHHPNLLTTLLDVQANSRQISLKRALLSTVLLIAGLSASGGVVTAQPGPSSDDRFCSGVIDGAQYCLNTSFGGPVTYPYDSDGDGIADTCSLPRTRRAAAARQNALEQLGTEQPGRLSDLFVQQCHGCMMTTIDIHDVLLERAKCHAKDTGQTLRSVVEDGLRRVLDEPKPAKPYRLEDQSYGDPDGPNPLENYTWAELRELIYEGTGA